MISRARLSLYPENRVLWMPTMLVVQRKIHGSGYPEVTNENPLFRSRVNALVHGDGEWNKRCADKGYRKILPQLLTNRRLGRSWFNAALQDQFAATDLLRNVEALLELAEERAQENMLPRNPWHPDFTDHFWGDDGPILLHDIDMARGSAQDALYSEKWFWQRVEYLKDPPPNEMEQFTPGEAPPYIESMVKRRRE